MKVEKKVEFMDSDFYIEPFDFEIFSSEYQSYPIKLKKAIEEIKDICNIEIRQAKMKRDKAIQKAIAKLM